MSDSERSRFARAKSSLTSAIVSAKKTLTSSAMKIALQGVEEKLDREASLRPQTTTVEDVASATSTQGSKGDKQPRGETGEPRPVRQTRSQTQGTYVWEGLVGGVTNVLAREHTAAGPPAPTAPRDLQGETGDAARLPRGEDGVELENASGLLAEQTPPTSTGELLDGAGGANSSPADELDLGEVEQHGLEQEEENKVATQEVVSHETEEHLAPGVGGDEKAGSADHTNLRYEAPREGEVKSERKSVPSQPLDEGILQALRASQQEGTRQLRWQFLCDLERGLSRFGTATERVYFAGPVEGIAPGTREGLPTAWMKEEGHWVYDLALDTAEKVLLALITSDADNLRGELKRGGLRAASKIRNSWREYLDLVILAGQDDQKAELYRRSTRVLTDWEVELIPESYKDKGLTWDELTDVSECEAERSRRAELQRRARPLRRLTKVKSELRDQPPPRLATLKKEESIPTNRGMKVEDDTFETQRPGDDAVTLKALRDQVARLEASQEEARLRRRLAELTKQGDSLLKGSPSTGSEAPMSSTMREERRVDKPTTRKTTQESDHGPSSNPELRYPVGATAGPIDPHTRRFLQTPFVTAVDEYLQTDAGKEAERMGDSRSRRPRRKGYQVRDETSSDEEQTPARPAIPTSGGVQGSH